MANDQGDKTEEPTSKKLDDARREGKVLKSVEVNGTVMIGAAILLLSVWGPHCLRKLMGLAVVTQGRAASYEFTRDSVIGYFNDGVLFIVVLLLPIAGPLLLVALGVNVAQVGFLLSSKPLAPSFSKLNPINGVKRIFSPRGAVELAKSIFKIASIATVVTLTIRAEMDSFVMLVGAPTAAVVAAIGRTTITLGLNVTIVLLVMALADYAFQRWQHLKDLRMTKQEVRDEAKQTEGDPQVKGRLRALMRQLSRSRMMSEVPTADVVITNPVHVAVALKYDLTAQGAPFVVAKGMRKIAERIKAVAREHDVPIVENPPLARQLHKLVDLGEPVPSSLYRAVAEVLAFVYRMKGRV